MYNHSQKSEEINNFLKDMPGILYWEKDASLSFIGSNNTCAKSFGFGHVDKILGSNDYEIPCGISEYAEVFRKNDRLVMEGNKAVKFFEILHCADGWKVMIITKAPLFDDQKNIIGTRGYSIDVTYPFANLGYLLLKNQPSFRKNKSMQASYFVGANDKLQLTNRQSECLFLLLRGKTIKEAAKFLKLSPRTIEDFVDQLKAKFNCQTKSELIAAAIEHGFLNVIPPQFLNQQLSIILE